MKQCRMFILIVISILLLTVPAMAQENVRDLKDVANIYYVSNGTMTKISKEAFPDFIANLESKTIHPSSHTPSQQNENDVDLKGVTDDWYRYDESSYQKKLMPSKRERITRVVHNGSNSPSSFSETYSASTSYFLSTSMSTAEWNALKAGISFGFNAYAQVSSTYSFNIPPKKYGWLEFEPWMNCSSGYMKTFSWQGNLKSRKYITLESPSKVGSELDGIIYEMVSSYPPSN